MKLYTKTGDKGQTGLIGGTRVAKNDIRLDAYGTIDELNSFIGVLTTQPISQKDLIFLRQIQNHLFAIGSYLATDTTKVPILQVSLINDEDIKAVENEIDRLDEFLPELTAFVLPGGSQSGALCHVCRTVARRAERRIYDMGNVYMIDNQIYVYLNRLSDYFFVLSRFMTLENGGEEIYWKRH